MSLRASVHEKHGSRRLLPVVFQRVPDTWREIPDRSVIAMGAVVVGHLDVAGALYGGVPARVLRPGVDKGEYFRRSRGYVGVTRPEDGDTPPRRDA